MISLHADPLTSPISILNSIVNNKDLILEMTRREVVGRYRGSMMGFAWSFFNPLLMLMVYVFVFSVVFKTRWGGSESQTSFAIILFVGMIIYGLFAEIANRAPSLVLSNVNYVKKVIFPLEILPLVALGATLFHALISLVVLLTAMLFINGSLPWTVTLLPFVVMPLVVGALGVSWFLASIGVFIRDIGQSIGFFTTVLMFLSPVFYPISALPEKFHFWIMLNPLTFIIEQSRAVIVFGLPLDWGGVAIYWFGSVLVAWGGYWWFQKTRQGFADVL